VSVLAPEVDTKETKNKRKPAGGWFKTSIKKYLFTPHVAKLWDSATGCCECQKFVSLAAGELLWELSPCPSLLPSTSRTSARTAGLLGHSSDTRSRIGPLTYLGTASSTEQRTADGTPALSTPTDAAVSLFPLAQHLSGKTLLVSFNGNSATQVKSLVLFSSFVATAISEFNSAACFSTATFAWQKN